MTSVYNKRVIAKHDHKVSAIKYFMEKSSSPCLYIYGAGATGKTYSINECVEKEIIHPKTTHNIEKQSINISLNPKHKRIFVSIAEPPAFMINNAYFLIYEFKADATMPQRKPHNTIVLDDESDSDCGCPYSESGSE